MSSFSRVLMATDLSHQSVNMTDGLTSLCPDKDTNVILAHVFEDDEDADPRSSQYKKILEKLKSFRNILSQEGYNNLNIITSRGDPAQEIHRLTEENDCDLIFVASHRKGFIRSAIMGTSTTYDLARATLQPLFIDKDDEDAQENLLAKVLVATDFSKKSLQALEFLRELRENVGSVLFVHVIEDEDDTNPGDAETFLKELVDEMKIFGISSEYVVREGVASKEIMRTAEEKGCQMITMAKTGAGATDLDPLGSTSKNLLMNAKCALLLIPDVDDD